MSLTAEQVREVIRESVGPLEERIKAFEDSNGQPKTPTDWRSRFTAAPSKRIRQRELDPIGNIGRDGRPDDRGLRMAGIVLSLVRSGMDIDRAARDIEERYPEKDAEIMLRALSTSDGADGGFLVVGDVYSDVVELLRPASIVRSLNPVTLPMPNGVLTLRKLAGGASASYTGENQDIGTTQPNFGELVLAEKKLTALVPISNDLIRKPSAGAEMTVRDDLVAAMAQRSDLAFIRGDGTQYTPKGMRYWATTANVFDANATVNLDNVTADLRDAVNLLEQGNVRMLRPGWMMSPRSKNYLMTLRDGNGNYVFRDEMLKGTLWEFPFKTTTQIPNTLGGGSNESEVYLVDFADMVIGESEGLILDASQEATYVEGGNTVSAYSRDQTVLRAIQLHDFGPRHDESIVVITAVTWGA